MIVLVAGGRPRPESPLTTRIEMSNSQGDNLRHLTLAVVLACVVLLVPRLPAQEPGAGAATRPAEIGPAFAIDQEQVAAAGIAGHTGRHLQLYTDIRQPERAAELVAAFDAAVPQWCQVFGIDPARAANWQMRAFLLADRESIQRFTRAGLLPGDLPDFAAGFQRDDNLWLFLQPGSYYTRHLLLHEGTHGFMQRFTGGYGAPWFSEGMAEQCGLHRWSAGQLQLRSRIQDREEAPYWGRVRLIIEEHATGKGMSLEDVLNIPTDSFRNVRYYAWSWAGCEFFRHHQRTSAAFEKLMKQTSQAPGPFTAGFRSQLAGDWEVLQRDWELFIDEIDYGYSVERGQLSAAQPAPFSNAWKINAERSWQQTSVQVQAGQRLRVTARGSFRVGQTTVAGADQEPRAWPWISQANGISIQYHRGQRLGHLQLGVLQTDAATPRQQVDTLCQPGSPDAEGVWVAPADGWLCLRINDSPARMDDNQGGLEVALERLE